MFYNYSNLPDVSADFTRETFRLLTGFSGLKLMNGYSEDSDAVLIGVVRSREKAVESMIPLNLRVAKSQASSSVGSNRQKFYVPGTNQMQLSLQVIVIKKPTEEELALLRSGIGEQIRANSRVIFNESFPVGAGLTREILDSEGTDVVATQNAGVQRRTVRTLAEAAATSIRDMILYAF